MIVEEQLDLLGREDPRLREVAIRKLGEFTHAEIASELRVSKTTIERMLQKIRSILEPRDDDDN